MVKADNFGIEKLKKQFFVFVVAKTTQKALSSGFFYFTFQNLPQRQQKIRVVRHRTDRRNRVPSARLTENRSLQRLQGIGSTEQRVVGGKF